MGLPRRTGFEDQLGHQALPLQAEIVRLRARSVGDPAQAYDREIARSLVQRIHNPRGRVCGCDPDCWCRRTALGRAVVWWFPGRYFGLHHKNKELEAWKGKQKHGELPTD